MVDYAPEGEYGREWLEGLLSNLVEDGLVEVEEADSGDETGVDDESNLSDEADMDETDLCDESETVARLRR